MRVIRIKVLAKKGDEVTSLLVTSTASDPITSSGCTIEPTHSSKSDDGELHPIHLTSPITLPQQMSKYGHKSLEKKGWYVVFKPLSPYSTPCLRFIE